MNGKTRGLSPSALSKKGLLAALAVFACTIVMALGLALPAQQAYAADDKTITIANAQDGQTYTLYKLFDATVNDERAAATDSSTTSDVMTAGINYTLPTGKSLETAAGGHLGTTWFSVDAGGNVKQVQDADITTTDFAEWAVAFGTQVGTPVTADDSGQVVFSNLSDGYYYITSSLGSLVTVTSVAPDALVRDKNENPDLEKIEDVKTSYSGDTVTYTVGISVPAGQTNVKFHDSLGEGLVLDGTEPVSVTVGSAEGNALDAANYTVDYWGSEKQDGDNITISFSEDYLGTLQNLTRVYLTYTATFQNQHVNAKNEAYVSYGESDTESNKKAVYESTFSFTVNKFDSNGTTALNGAKFALSENGRLGNLTEDNLADHSGDLLKFTSTGLFDRNGDTTLFSADNSVSFSGLNNDVGNDTVTYYLYEVTAPDGYNKLTGPVEIQIVPTIISGTNDSQQGGSYVQSYVVNYKMPGDANYSQAVDNAGQTATGVDVAHNINITNNKGVALPSTGGMGTTILYIIGGVLVVVAAVALIVRKRMQQQR